MQTDINAVKLYRRGLQSAGFDVLDGYFIRYRWLMSVHRKLSLHGSDHEQRHTPMCGKGVLVQFVAVNASAG
jgi:hypothetical protein